MEQQDALKRTGNHVRF